MLPDLPASLVAELLDWVACDECGGSGCIRHDGEHTRWVCPHPHTVVIVHEGRRIHADPERVEWRRVEHRSTFPNGPDSVCHDWTLNCRTTINDEQCLPVLRPVVPIDLEEA